MQRNYGRNFYKSFSAFCYNPKLKGRQIHRHPHTHAHTETHTEFRKQYQVASNRFYQN